MSSKNKFDLTSRTPQLMSYPTPPGEMTPPSAGIGGTHSTDAKTISPVDVGHGQAGMLNTWQERDIGDLFWCRVCPESTR